MWRSSVDVFLTLEPRLSTKSRENGESYYSIKNQSNQPLVNDHSKSWSITTNQNRISQTITVYMHEIQLTFCCEVLVRKHFLKASVNLKFPLFSRDFLGTTKDRYSNHYLTLEKRRALQSTLKRTKRRQLPSKIWKRYTWTF